MNFSKVWLNVYVIKILWLTGLQVCNGTTNGTHVECWTPALRSEPPGDKSDTGNISIVMDGRSDLWRRRFDYHPDVVFRSQDNELVLKPGTTEVSLRVSLHLIYEP